jgi:mRNA interferase MazF
VLSSKSFNSRTSLAFVCPITSRVKGYPFEVVLPTHLPLHGVVLCEHLRSMDWQARRVTFIGKAPEEVVLEVREVIAAIACVSLE